MKNNKIIIRKNAEPVVNAKIFEAWLQLELTNSFNFEVQEKVVEKFHFSRQGRSVYGTS